MTLELLISQERRVLHAIQDSLCPVRQQVECLLYGCVFAQSLKKTTCLIQWKYPGTR
jgi:hypothetical protein